MDKREIKQRTIKFRAWDKKFKEFSEEPFFRLLISKDGQVYNSENDAWYKPNARYIIQMYTGLLDKNGVQIYEGDIIKWKFVNTGEEEPEYTETVEWSECGFFLDGGAPLTVAMDDCEVIGNIFQPPIDKEPIK